MLLYCVCGMWVLLVEINNKTCDVEIWKENLDFGERMLIAMNVVRRLRWKRTTLTTHDHRHSHFNSAFLSSSSSSSSSLLLLLCCLLSILVKQPIGHCRWPDVKLLIIVMTTISIVNGRACVSNFGGRMHWHKVSSKTAWMAFWPGILLRLLSLSQTRDGIYRMHVIAEATCAHDHSGLRQTYTEHTQREKERWNYLILISRIMAAW